MKLKPVYDTFLVTAGKPHPKKYNQKHFWNYLVNLLNGWKILGSSNWTVRRRPELPGMRFRPGFAACTPGNMMILYTQEPACHETFNTEHKFVFDLIKMVPDDGIAAIPPEEPKPDTAEQVVLNQEFNVFREEAQFYREEMKLMMREPSIPSDFSWVDTRQDAPFSLDGFVPPEPLPVVDELLPQFQLSMAYRGNAWKPFYSKTGRIPEIEITLDGHECPTDIVSCDMFANQKPDAPNKVTSKNSFFLGLKAAVEKLFPDAFVQTRQYLGYGQCVYMAWPHKATDDTDQELCGCWLTDGQDSWEECRDNFVQIWFVENSFFERYYLADAMDRELKNRVNQTPEKSGELTA